MLDVLNFLGVDTLTVEYKKDKRNADGIHATVMYMDESIEISDISSLVNYITSMPYLNDITYRDMLCRSGGFDKYMITYAELDSHGVKIVHSPTSVTNSGDFIMCITHKYENVDLIDLSEFKYIYSFNVVDVYDTNMTCKTEYHIRGIK